MADCNTLVYEGKEYSREEFVKGITSGELYLPPNARQAVNDRLSMAREKGADDLVADTYTRDFKAMPFKFSGNRIVSGEKTITVRPGVYSAGTYKDIATGGLFNVLPEGNMTIESYLAASGISEGEFKKRFIGQEEAKQPYIQAFLKNEIPLNIYSVRKVDSADDVMPDAMDSRFARLYDDRTAIVRKLKEELKRAKGPQKEAIRERIHRVEAQVEQLKNEDNQTISQVVDMMESDMDAVQNLLDSGADRKALEYAAALLHNYANMLGVQFRETVDLLDPDTRLRIMAFQSRNVDLAQRIKEQLFTIPVATVKAMTGKDVQMINGLPVYDKDINPISRFLLDTSTTDNPIVQTLTRFIGDAIRKFAMRFESFKVDHRKLVKNLISFQKDAGVAKDDHYEFMLQRDGDGKRTGLFVGRLSNAYSVAKSGTKGMHRLFFYARNHDFAVNKDVWKAKEAKLIQWYKDNLSHYAELNDMDTAAGVTFEQKLDKQARAFAYKRNPLTMKKIFDKALATPQQIQPGELEFFKYFEKNGGFGLEYIDGSYQRAFEANAHAQWEDPKYREITAMSKEDPRKQFYEHFSKTFQEGRQALSDEEFYLPWNYIPEKTKDLGVGGNLRQWAVNNLSQVISENIHGRDPVTQEVIKRIPVYMVAQKISAEDKSYNLGDVLESFMREVINHDEKSLIEDDANLLLALLKEQKVPETNADGSTKVINGEVQYKQGLTNTYQQAQYRVNANLYDERQDKEGVTKMKLRHTLVVREMKKLRIDMKNLGLSDDEEAEGWEMIRNGGPYVGNDDRMAQFVQMGMRAKELKSQGGNVTWSKAVNTLIYYTSTKLLGLNVFGGLAELLQGWTSLFTESAAGRYMTDKGALAAMGDLFKSMGPDSPLKHKLHNLGKYFGSHIDRAMQDNQIADQVGKVAFFQWELANRTTNIMFLNAMLRHEKVVDKDGTEHSLFDVIHVDDYGHFSLEGNFDNPFHETDGSASKYLLDLQHKYRQLIKDNRERQTFDDPAELEKTMVGRILGQFKKNWLFVALYARFGEYREADINRGLDSKGFYRSFFEQFKLRKIEDDFGDEVTDYSPAGFMEMMGRVLKSFVQYSTLGRKLGAKPGSQSELDQANLRKFMREMGLIVSTSIAVIILSSMGGGDGDDKNRFRQYSINQLIRLDRDLSMYINPSDMASVLKNPAPVVGTLSDIFSIGGAMIQSGILMDPYTHTPGNHQLRIVKAVQRNIPFANQYDRFMSKIDKTMNYIGY